MKFNKHLDLPDPVDPEQEALIQYQKTKTVESDSLNTEEICSEVIKANDKIQSENSMRVQHNRKVKVVTRKQKMFVEDYVVGSMDVEALYPSLQWAASCQELLLAAKESRIHLRNFNFQEICRYVALTCSGPEIRAQGMSEFVPKVLPGGSLAKSGRMGYQGELSSPPDQQPGDREKWSLLGFALGKGTEKCLANHYYNFGGEIYRQTKGGSIGSELTGEISTVYMTRWDRKSLKKLRKLGFQVVLYKIYVDDILIAAKAISLGMRYEPVKGQLVVIEDLVQADQERNIDQRTLEVICSVANTIDNDIN